MKTYFSFSNMFLHLINKTEVPKRATKGGHKKNVNRDSTLATSLEKKFAVKNFASNSTRNSIGSKKNSTSSQIFKEKKSEVFRGKSSVSDADEFRLKSCADLDLPELPPDDADLNPTTFSYVPTTPNKQSAQVKPETVKREKSSGANETNSLKKFVKSESKKLFRQSQSPAKYPKSSVASENNPSSVDRSGTPPPELSESSNDMSASRFYAKFEVQDVDQFRDRSDSNSHSFSANGSKSGSVNTSQRQDMDQLVDQAKIALDDLEKISSKSELRGKATNPVEDQKNEILNDPLTELEKYVSDAQLNFLTPPGVKIEIEKINSIIPDIEADIKKLDILLPSLIKEHRPQGTENLMKEHEALKKETKHISKELDSLIQDFERDSGIAKSTSSDK